MKKAFTLIELMVVVGLVILLTIGSIAGISASRDRKQTKTAAEKLKSFLMEARSKAMSPDDTSFGVTRLRVEINDKTVTNQNVVKLYQVGSSGNLGELASPKFNIPMGITIAPASNMMALTTGCYNTDPCSYFTFSTAGSNIGQIDSTIGSSITINVSSGSDIYKVEINALTGLITVHQ